MGTIAPLCQELLVRIDNGQTSVEQIAAASDRPAHLIEELVTGSLNGRYIDVSESGQLSLTSRGEREAEQSPFAQSLGITP